MYFFQQVKSSLVGLLVGEVRAKLQWMGETATASELSAILEGLCPSGLGSSVSCADSTAGLPSDWERVSNWSKVRAKEYIGGRYCAREALARGGFAGEAYLERDASGLPRWPDGYSGSISHCRGWCMAVAGQASLFPVLGLDLERTDRIHKGAADRVAHPLEKSFWNGEQLQASILFSLKEAFYKAQFPRWGLPAGFGDMALEVDMKEGSARIAILADHLSKGIESRSSGDFGFRFALGVSHVVSLCWVQG